MMPSGCPPWYGSDDRFFVRPAGSMTRRQLCAGTRAVAPSSSSSVIQSSRQLSHRLSNLRPRPRSRAIDDRKQGLVVHECPHLPVPNAVFLGWREVTLSSLSRYPHFNRSGSRLRGCLTAVDGAPDHAVCGTSGASSRRLAADPEKFSLLSRRRPCATGPASVRSPQGRSVCHTDLTDPFDWSPKLPANCHSQA